MQGMRIIFVDFSLVRVVTGRQELTFQAINLKTKFKNFVHQRAIGIEKNLATSEIWSEIGLFRQRAWHIKTFTS
jgi:hypothetical protein